MRPIALIGLLVMSVGCRTSLNSQNHADIVATRKDAEIDKAIQAAQKSLPTFLARLKNPLPGDRFALKARFPLDNSYEHMWVDHLTLVGGAIEGQLADQPVMLKSFHKGDHVRIEPSDIDDWLILSKDGKREGGFTEPVLRSRQARG